LYILKLFDYNVMAVLTNGGNMHKLTEDQARQAVDALIRVSTFDNHKELFEWANAPETTELFDAIRALLKDINAGGKQ
jgi:ribonuclease D